MKMSESCVACLLGKNLNQYPKTANEEEIKAYQAEISRTIDENKNFSAPEVVERLEQVRASFFGQNEDFENIKRRFNALMLEFEPKLRAMIDASKNPFRRAIQYAMMGNFIDFGALEQVEEDKLRYFLKSADRAELDEKVTEALQNELQNANRLVYFTDNCGEIVADKLLIATIRKINPKLHITVVVRGENVLNDATETDAEQVGLYEVADKVIGNGTGIAGTVLSRVNEQTKRAIESADVMIAKGQGNYESLCGCGLNLYYLFMCKCELFVNRFQVPQYSGILTREKR